MMKKYVVLLVVVSLVCQSVVYSAKNYSNHNTGIYDVDKILNGWGDAISLDDKEIVQDEKTEENPSSCKMPKTLKESIGLTLRELFDMLIATGCWVSLAAFFTYRAKIKQMQRDSRRKNLKKIIQAVQNKSSLLENKLSAK